MTTKPYSDLLSVVKALCGVEFATIELGRINAFVNRRAKRAYRASNNWPRLHADAKWSINAAIKTSFADGLKELAKYGVAIQDINAHAFSIEREPLLLLDQYMMQIEGRRTFALREIERRRATLGRQLTSVIKEVEGEFKEVRIEESLSNTKEA